MRFLGAAFPHADYLLSLSFQSARRSFLFRLSRRISSAATDRHSDQRVSAPEKNGLAGHESNDNSRTAVRPGGQPKT